MSVNPFTSLPDTELIEACLNGREQAWEALLGRFQRLIYSIPFRYGLAETDANDIFQNVSMILLENLHSLRNRQRLGAWLVITTRRECWRLSHQQRPANTQENESIDDKPDGKTPSEEEMVLLESQSLLRAGLEQLESPCRELLGLLFYSEPRATYTEIARRLALPEGSIGPNRARCLEKLMRILETMGFSEM